MNKTTPQQILRLFQTVTVHLLCIPLMSTCFADEQSQLEESKRPGKPFLPVSVVLGPV